MKMTGKTIWSILGTVLLTTLLSAWVGYALLQQNYILLLGSLIAIIFTVLILKQPILGIYFLVFFLPFERIGSVDFSNVTIRISQIVLIITLLVWAARGFFLNKFKLRPNPLFFPMLIFFAINVIGLLNTPNLRRSLLVLGFSVFTMCTAIITPNVLRHKWQIKTVLIILLISATIVSLFGLYQWLGDFVGLSTKLTGLRPQYTKAILGFPRVQSTALEPLYFANYLLIPLSLALSFLFSKASKIKPIWLIGFIALTGINLVLTVARGGYIAFALCLVLLLSIYIKKIVHSRALLYLGAITILVLVISFQFLQSTNKLAAFEKHVTDLFNGASYVERVNTVTQAEHAWLTHPWFGIGAGGFGPYVSSQPLVAPADGYLIVNNEYVELLAETGVLGLGTYLLIIIILLVRSLKAWRVGQDPMLRAMLVGLVTAFIGISVQYYTFSILYIMHIWFTIGLLIAVQNLLLHDYDNKTIPTQTQ